MSAKQFDDFLDNLVRQSYEYGDGTPIAPDVVAHQSELAALRAERDALLAELAEYRTLRPAKCRPDCYRKGWDAAIEAAATASDERNIGNVMYPWTDPGYGEMIRALVPPDDCGGACNPLEPDADEFDGIMCQCACGCSSQATRYVDGMPSCEGCYQAS